jgi:iron complex outermembrane recepter protein
MRHSILNSTRRSSLISTLLVLFVGYVGAQSSAAELKGIVTDENNAVIAGAALSLRRDGAEIRSTMTSDQGEFSFGEIAYGEYLLLVTKAGFADIERKVVVHNALENTEMKLAAGGVAATVTVVMDSADAAASSTLKLEQSIHETPRSVQVISEDRMREQNFRQVPDILNYVPGTSQNSFRNGSYHFYSRGYRMGPDDTRVDGFVGINVGSGGFGASTFGIEEAVVLRGPASLLYGQTGSPGGLINLISKRPREDRFTRIDVRTGGYSGNGVSLGERPLFGVDIDTTGTLVKSGRILYRGLASLENMNYFTRDTLDRNRYINGSLTFKLDEDGRFTLTPSAQFTRYNRPFGGGIVISPSSSLSTSPTAVADPVNAPLNQNDLSPLDVNLFGGRRIEETGWAGIDFRGVPTSRIRLNAAYRYVSFDTDINSFTPQASTNAQISQLRNNYVVSRVQAKSLTQRNYHNANADASWEWLATPLIRNTTQVGFYTRILDSRTTTPAGAIPAAQSPINIYTGVAQTGLVDNFPAINFGAWGRDVIWNGFLQNRTSVFGGRLNLNLGFNYGQQNPVTGATRKSGFIPNAAVLFNATKELAVYASYSTSFNPTDPTFEDVNGRQGTFDPTIGKSYEVGAKYDLLNRRVSVAASLFHNQVDNALVQSDSGVLNSNNLRYYIPAGTRRSRGLDLNGTFVIREDLSVKAGLAYTAAIYKGFPAGAPVGTAPIPNSWAEKTPHFSYSLYTRYDRREGYLKGFGAGVGIVWQGKRLGSNGARTFAASDVLVLPSFTKVDTALFYRLNRYINFGLNIDNLFDERIFVSGSVASALELAAPRTATLRTTFNF